MWYFDEVYHGYTAVEYARNNPAAYDPWASSPPGVAFEWVHPPLAKLIMSWSVHLFGPVSWAWRLPSAFFGTAVIGLTGVLAWVWFKDARLSLLASTFLALDGLVLVMSRLAMNDVFFLTFLLAALITYTLMWRSQSRERFVTWSILCGVTLGLALASKWTTVYILPVLGLDIAWRWWQSGKIFWKTLLPVGVSLGIFPIVMYLLAHTQYFSWGYTWSDFIMLQKQIWWYHTGLEATHPYQSTPLQWFLDIRPVWFFSGSTAEVSQNIYALGNPIFFWSGLVAVIFFAKRILLDSVSRAQNWTESFLFTCFLAVWLPWTFSPRIMFFYHFLPALPFLAIILARQIRLHERSTGKHSFVQTSVVLAGMAVWLIIFFPHLTALPVDRSWADSIYYIIPSWR